MLPGNIRTLDLCYPAPWREPEVDFLSNREPPGRKQPACRTLHATPYDISHEGFYFDSAEDFAEQMSTALFEEVEIQFIDGTDEECLIFKLCKPHQGNVAGYYEAVDAGHEAHQLAALSYLVEYQGTAWEDATAPGALGDVDAYADDR